MKNQKFDTEKFKKETIVKIKEVKALNAPIQHAELLEALLNRIEKMDFRDLAELKDENQKLQKKHYLVCCIEQILELAKIENWGLCKYNESLFLYNGGYWNLIEEDEMITFLGRAAEKMGIEKFDSRYYSFKEHLHKQFLSAANLPKPKRPKKKVLINLQNGTFEINGSKQELRAFDSSDFLTYQLPFEYNPKANAPQFNTYLNQVLPDKERQLVLSEFLGYLFIKSGTLKLEKALLLYGNGANGKSVFFEIVNALLGGSENVSNHSLQSLTDKDGYYRAMLGNKLVNYASEINGKLESSIFKQLVSNEPVSARMPYGIPITVTDYAKLIFNCNELPKDIEMTNAFFRRFLIIAFDICIPEEEQDKELANKIIESELSGVFNWVLDGLNRLLDQKKFTYSASIENEVNKYRSQSDSVQLFLSDEDFEPSTVDHESFKDFYSNYRHYCNDSGYIACSKRKFGDRLRALKFEIVKRNHGMIIYVKKMFISDSPGTLDSPFK